MYHGTESFSSDDNLNLHSFPQPRQCHHTKVRVGVTFVFFLNSSYVINKDAKNTRG